jgi:hypothetical protein
MAGRQYLIFWLVEKLPVLTITGGVAGLLFLVEWAGHNGRIEVARPMSEIWWHLPAYWIATWAVLVVYAAVAKLTHRD